MTLHAILRMSKAAAGSSQQGLNKSGNARQAEKVAGQRRLPEASRELQTPRPHVQNCGMHEVSWRDSLSEQALHTQDSLQLANGQIALGLWPASGNNPSSKHKAT